ncbi:hypothetical protein WR25_03089 [Diploscapter pachys]|uniref:Selenoprotein P N-terminal domain-containing protein n=1 Tax=Diploscapter pachys TaxID=2018661 RepID=A0A2A2L5R1_9BILA|nr:hypothetical protein WR25_03089 [Diploscapter pachys]
MLLLATRFLCFSVALSYSLTPSLCQQDKLTVRGRDFIQDSKGQLVLAVFSPIQCTQCYKIFRELNFLAAKIREVRIVVFVPGYESPTSVDRAQREFNYLIFERDDQDRSWLDYQAQRHDQILFDRCGRLSQRLYHPRADLTQYQDTVEAIQRNLRGEVCGPCIKNPDGEAKSREQRSRMGINAYIASRPKTSDRNDEEEQRRREYYQRQQNQVTHRQNPDPRRQESDDRRHAMRTDSQSDFRPTVPPASSFQQAEPLQTTKRSFLITTQASSKDSDTDVDYSEYYNDVDPANIVATTQQPETQIPKPQPQKDDWPTQLPLTQISKPQFESRSYKVDEPFGPIVSEGNIPCTAYTDEICYEQQERQGTLSKCCKKGVYLTDVCTPGKCSNSTVQLCCFQKFLQAKFTCCEDSSQGEGTNSTNNFSKCCYDNFVEYDECCPKESARDYWKSVYDVCYPNTKVDYSTIKLEVDA